MAHPAQTSEVARHRPANSRCVTCLMLFRPIIAGLICALILSVVPATAHHGVSQSPPSSSGKLDVILSGEISSGDSFVRDIGNGLIFRLVPSPAGFGNGWDIEIAPKEIPAGGYSEYSAIVTPPYHFYNMRYVNASYGVTARQAVAISPRVFQFAETPEDMQAASVVVNSIIYSVDWPSRKDSLAAAASKVPLGAGEFRILRSRTTLGKNNEDLGSIDWLKFEVRLRFHSGLTLQQVLFPGDTPPR
jgi:hypothetical protein